MSTFPSRFVNLSAARLQFGDRVDRLGTYLTKLDPVADDVIASLATLPKGEGWRLVEQGLRGDAIPTAPRAIHALLDEARSVPAWVDFKACDRGGETFLRSGMLGGLALGAKSLVLGYASPGGNKPLVLSGRLKEQAGRRLNETARFVQAVSRPGGMRPFADGWQITLKVRLIHAQVRSMIRASGRWDAPAWGEPVNQHDMAGTTLLFSIAIVEGLRDLGLHLTAQDADSYMHLWRWVGTVIGVDPGLQPASEHDAIRLAELMSATTAPPDQDSRDLTAALFMAGEQDAKTEKQRQNAVRRRRFGQTLARELLGAELADQLGIPRLNGRFVMPMVRRIVSGVEQVRRAVPFADQRAVAAGARYWDRVVKFGLTSTFDFGLPEHLAA